MTSLPGVGIGDGDETRDTYCTPKEWALRVGPVWLDCATNPRAHILASKTFMLEHGQDALVLARYVSRNPPGPVFCNPPYSRGMVEQFVEAYLHTRFIFLVRMDTSTRWWRTLYSRAGALALPDERIDFEPPPGIDGGPSNPYPHAFVYSRPEDIAPEMHAHCYVVTPHRG